MRMKVVPLVITIASWALCGCAGDEGEGDLDGGADGGDTDVDSDADTDTAPGPYAALFDEVWQILQDEYPYMDYKSIDWHALGDECRAIASGDDATYDIWLNQAMDCLLGPLADYHVAILDMNDEWHGYGVLGWTGNFDDDLADTYLVDGGVAAGPYGDVRLGTTVDGGFGYIRVGTWAPASLAGVDFTELIELLGDVPGIAVDVRANSGGSELEAMELAGQFVTDTETPYAFYQLREEIDDDETTHELSSSHDKTMWPEYVVDAPFEGPVAVLIGHKCMSSCELFVAMTGLAGSAETFGATTRGSSGNPVDAELSNGTVLHHSTWLLTLADGETVLEWNGIDPDHPVEFTGASGDEVLEAAIDWLGEQ
jgi:hypothetical protein